MSTCPNDVGSGPPLLEAHNLKMAFRVRRSLSDAVLRRQRLWIHAVDGVSLVIRRGETLGIVGESGCGKSTLGRLVACLERPTDGQVVFNQQDVTKLSQRELRRVHRSLQIVFQDPYSTLNPRMRVGAMLAEALRVHHMCEKSDVERRVGELLSIVELSPDIARRRPGQLSGGQRQRVGIARALTVEPTLVVADEPVSSLDVSVQAQILNLLNDLKHSLGLAWMFIGHNLATVRQVSDRIAVMYLGRIVEQGPASVVLSEPLHPYTQALLRAVPHPDPMVAMEASGLSGDPPSPIRIPSGCRFASRCPLVRSFCRENDPGLTRAAADHEVACWAISERASWESRGR